MKVKAVHTLSVLSTLNRAGCCALRQRCRCPDCQAGRHIIGDLSRALALGHTIAIRQINGDVQMRVLRNPRAGVKLATQ